MTTYKRNPEGGGDCVSCDCNSEGSVNQLCDPIEGTCQCVPGLTADAGIQCVSVILLRSNNRVINYNAKKKSKS